MDTHKILEWNSAMGVHNPRAYKYVDAVPPASRLARTRAFVIWYRETVITRDEYGRPCHKTSREEIARGRA